MAGFGLYVHWPYCEAKCPYCDFNSHVAASVDHAAWARALVTDLRAQAPAMEGAILGSIFFGGGTPSRMAPETVAAVIDAARALWPTVNDLEVTLEANPTSVEAGRFASFRAAGVNRVSLGVQSLRDADLRALGRTHDAAQARAAWDVARATFDRASLDLIYARAHQDPRAWEAELREALTWDPTHLSIYQLTIEPGTVFARRHEAGRLPGLPHDDAQADMYLLSQDILGSAGLSAYEVSNHATPESECHHNLTYWRAGDWLGVGPGAHGRHGFGPTRRATVAVRQPEAWLDAVTRTGTGIETKDDDTDHAQEYLMTALRLREGLSLDRLSALGSTPRADAIAVLVEEGLLTASEERLIPTDRGRALADGVVGYLANRLEADAVNSSQSRSRSSKLA